ncbi:mercury(II) reductase [Sulfolobales archaeon HS-7]|nr:mercury(II) reductase [Sulfolobales archaeon HS-7]
MLLKRKLIILGYGAAGFAAVIRANELGIKPTLVGEGEIGGTCVNVGCVPSKRLLRLGEIYSYKGKLPENYRTLFDDKDKLVSALRAEKYEKVLGAYDVELIKGKARFTSPTSIKVNGDVMEGEKFVIATGSSPAIPDIPGLREVGYWTNVEALSPDKDIDSLIIIGGRAVALEFAQMYRRLGKDVAVIQRSPTLIPDWEPEISIAAREMLESEGIFVVTNAKVKEVNKGKKVVTDRGEIEGDEILIATGRRPNVDLALEQANIELNERGGIKVDDELRTTNPNVYAAGDVIGGNMLEALAGKEGVVAVDNAISNAHRRIDLLSVPRAIFTQPNLASVGLREAEVRNGESRTVFMRDVAKANILGDTKGLIKMVAEKGSRRILGVHMMGENAAEVINEAALAIHFKMKVDDVVDTVHVFPTMAESIKLAASAFFRDVTRMSCCVD